VILGRTAAAGTLAAILARGPAWAGDGVTADLRATVQFDAIALASASLPPGERISTGGSFRRVRVGFDGKLGSDWEYGFTARLETASLHYMQVTNAFVQFDGLTPLHFKAGIFSPPENFEDATSSSEVLFLERAQPADLARGLGSGTGRTAATLFAYDDSAFAALSLAGGVANDAPARQGSLIGRFAWRPWHDRDSGFAIGGDTTFLFAPPGTGTTHDVQLRQRPELNGQSVDLRLVDTGFVDTDSVSEFGVEASGNVANLHAQAGLFHYTVGRARPALANPQFHGWYLQGSWVLTGEVKPWRIAKGGYGAPAPHRTLGAGGMGAFELGARYSELNLDHDAGAALTPILPDAIRGGRQRIVTLGLNWYPGDPFRFLLDYQHVTVSRLSAAGGDLGASADLVSLRSQISF
jgi:phosphate-selective porin OprO/OprP